ncbi:MAG: glycosyltransferase family 2 protein [Candidatus Caccosoma sp.]|nr:glycosyltransferase family 2 protein [Candidatus Caccosoma sp.]
MSKLISIIVPCFNEQEALPIFYETIIPYLNRLNTDYEILFIDDGSKDNTPNIIKDIATNDKNIKYIIFSRNFGKEAAMYAGLKNSKGDYVAVMDVDLQDPPEKLLEMYDILENEDYDCVATRRVTRKGEPKIRSFFARQFYRLINKISQTEIVDGARDYRLMKRCMVDAILKMSEYNRFSKGIFSFVGFKTKWLEYENIQRCAGVTKWSFKKLFIYAIEGIIAFTLAPLYFIIKLGLFLLAADFIALLTFIVLAICNINCFKSYVILILCLAFFTAILLICLGVVALYQAKIYSEVKNRPIYIGKETNIEND